MTTSGATDLVIAVVCQGCNSRLDELQAAFLAAKLPHLERMNQERRRIADRYRSEIHNPQVTLPTVMEQNTHVWHIFAVRCAQRDALAAMLEANGVQTNRHYPIAIHRQECYRDLQLPRGALPIAEEISATQLSLPMFYGMTEEQIDQVIRSVNAFRG